MKIHTLKQYSLFLSVCICVVFVFLLSPLHLSAKESVTGKSIFTLSLYENPVDRTIALIKNSKQQIKAVIYKFEEKSLLAAIKDAHDRGINIQLVVDQKESESKKSKVAKAAAYGVSVRTWSQGKLHAKFAIIDTSQVLTGSFNWTKSAKKTNVELISYYHDSMTAKIFIDLFDDLWNKASPK